MKVTIDEICEFLRIGWPGDDWYIEDEENPEAWEQHLHFETYQPKEPGTIVDIRDFEACVMWQNASNDQTASDPTNGRGYSFCNLFKKWLKTKDTVTLVVEVKTHFAEDVISAIKAAGGKILTK